MKISHTAASVEDKTEFSVCLKVLKSQPWVTVESFNRLTNAYMQGNIRRDVGRSAAACH